MNMTTFARAQEAYDNRLPPDDDEIDVLELLDLAISELETVRRLMNYECPRVSEAGAYYDEAIGYLAQIDLGSGGL